LHGVRKKRLHIKGSESGTAERRQSGDCEQSASEMREVIDVALYAFGGWAWTFFALSIQENFFWPEDLSRQQKDQLVRGKWWITLMGAVGGAIIAYLI
jgi:hypothetical protein